MNKVCADFSGCDLYIVFTVKVPAFVILSKLKSSFDHFDLFCIIAADICKYKRSILAVIITLIGNRLIIIDIDFFKNFNDTFGHQSGDAVLRQVAFVLKKNVRMSDIVCRYGGEEMSIILPSTTYDEAVNLANKLCRLVSDRKYKLSNGKESNVTISLGVSAFGPKDGQTPAELIEAADKRLYNAKNNGRNRVN